MIETISKFILGLWTNVTILTVSAACAGPLQQASPEDIVDQLSPLLKQDGAQTRSLRNLTPVPRALDLTVFFDFNSADLQSRSEPLLKNLALALQNPRLESLHFAIEGHTDAKGGSVYNQKLSQRRAQSVVDFLVQQGVSPDRLRAVGKGSSELLTPQRPFADENRRVRVRSL